MTAIDLHPLLLSLRLAAVTTIVLLFAGTPLAWWLARTGSKLRAPIEAFVAMPLVLPPTVLGFYLLLALGPDGPIGGVWRELGGGPLVFSFTGLVVGSVIYSLPFVVQPLQASFESVGRTPLEVAATLGFAHTLGEFGVVLMIGGNIPGKTRVVSIAIYDHVETLSYSEAHVLAAILLVFSFVVLLGVFVVNRRLGRVSFS